jgi:hypothetical protein
MLQVTSCGWLGFSDSTALYRCKIINVCLFILFMRKTLQ